MVNNANTTIVTPGIHIAGSLAGKGDVLVDGRLNGSITLDGDLVVGSSGKVDAGVQTSTATVGGLIRGQWSADSGVNITAGAQVEATVTSKRIEIDPQARVKGRLVMPMTLPRGVTVPASRSGRGF